MRALPSAPAPPLVPPEGTDPAGERDAPPELPLPGMPLPPPGLPPGIGTPLGSGLLPAPPPPAPPLEPPAPPELPLGPPDEPDAPPLEPDCVGDWGCCGYSGVMGAQAQSRVRAAISISFSKVAMFVSFAH